MLQILPVIEESSLEFWMSRLSIFDLHAAGFEMQTWTTRTLQWCKKLCQGNYTLPEFCKMYISDHFQNFIGFYRPISWLIRCFFFPDIFQHIFFSAARWAASQTTRPPSRWFSTQPDETSGFVAAVIRNSLQSSPEKKKHGFRVGFEEFDTWDFNLWQGETLGKCMFAICIHATEATSTGY